MSNQVNVVELVVSICVRLQPTYPFYQRVFPNQCDTCIGIRLTAMPPVPHLLLFRLRHIIPLFGLDESPFGIKEESTLIHDRFRYLTAERNIRAREKVGKQRLRENVTIQERFVPECHPDPFRVRFVKCWQCRL